MNETVISKFQIYDQIDLRKSVLSIKGSGTVEDPYTECFVEGRCLNMVKDVSGERPIVPKMDWSYFDKQGFVKAEHDPVTTEIDKSKGTVKITHTPTFANHIGVAIERKRTPDGKGEFIKAGLFANLAKAKETIDLMKALEEWNKRHPENPRTMGWSIEGDYIAKSTAGDFIGKVYNIVLTASPQDATTYAQFVQEKNTTLAKSLAAGYATAPADKTGGGALRRESLEGADKNNSKKEKKAMLYKTEFDAYKALCAGGMDKEEAKKKAKEVFAEQKKKKVEENDDMEKGITGIMDLCKSAITGVEALVNSFKEPSAEMVAFDNNLKKSLTKVKAGEAEELDGILAFLEHGQQVLETRTESRTIGNELAKGIISLLKIQEQNAGFFKGLLQVATEAREQAEEATRRITALTVGVQLSKSLLSTDASVLSTTKPAATAAGEPAEILKSITGKRIEDYLINKGIAAGEKGGTVYFNLQTRFRQSGQNIDVLPADIQAQIAKDFAPATE
jgi:hypothetical protein